MTLIDRILETKSSRRSRFYFAAISDLFVAKVRGSREAEADALGALSKTMADTMAMAEVFGARYALAAARRGQQFADNPEHAILPNVTLEEALEDLVTRAPVTLKNAAQRTADQIAELYTQDRVIAFARSAEETVTKEAQRFLADAQLRGIDEGEAGRELAMSVNSVRSRSDEWSEGYARMVFRNNIGNAVTAGRFRQVRDPDIKAAVPAFRFDATGDSDTRDNHMAADGLIFSVDSPVWLTIAPPIGHNCRCGVSHVSSVELEAMGRLRDDGSVVDDTLPGDAFPDPGFRKGTRPDLMLS